jgi:hypothetical protein
MAAGDDLLLEQAASRFAHDDSAGRGVRGIAKIGAFSGHGLLLRMFGG